MSIAASAPQSAFPVVIYNPPGLSAVNYRVGDFASFREALLQSLPGEVELQGWRPTADGDLALQLLEWWAYLADILTFYNERIANNAYLGTAVLPASSQPQTGSPGPTSAAPGLPDNPTLIAQASGFQSTPGIASTGLLAVLVNSPTPISLPPRFAVQSKPGPGQQPQVFETADSGDMYLPTNSGGVVPVDVSWSTYFTSGGVTTNATANAPASKAGPLLSGTITSIKPNDVVAVAPISQSFATAASVAAIVQSVTTEMDPRGQTNTRLSFQSFDPPTSFNGVEVTKFQLLRSNQSITAYSYNNENGDAPALSGLTPGATPLGIHLASLARDIVVGDLLVLELVDPNGASVASVTGVVKTYQETIWYANADHPTSAPQNPPATTAVSTQTVAIPIPHTFLTFVADASGQDPIQAIANSNQSVSRVLFGFRSVSVLLDEMPQSIPPASSISSYNVLPSEGAMNTRAQSGASVLLEGADGVGATAILAAPLKPGEPIQLASWDIAASLTPPLRLLFNVITVTAGKTVPNEVLGDGDATVASQSFTLQKSPLTYLKGTDPNSPISTLQVFVDNVAWTEASSFHGQSGDAKIFVTQRDKNQNTTVIFGDGINGARLTTGAGNVTAAYRYGSGPGNPNLGGPAQGSVVTVTTPTPGLASARNPVPMTGGSAPSTPSQVQQNAANSVLTFGRAVSPGDYEVIAARAASAQRTRALSAWDPQRCRNVFMIYVSGGPDCVAEAQAALAATADPNLPIVVNRATEIDLRLSLNVTYDRGVDPARIKERIVSALTDPSAGLFAPSQMPIGATLYESQIYMACDKVAGVIALRGLTLRNITNLTPTEFPTAPRLLGVAHRPSTGGFFVVAPSNVDITLEAGDG
jgi:predicted phage baseplate assembly protein